MTTTDPYETCTGIGGSPIYPSFRGTCFAPQNEHWKNRTKKQHKNTHFIIFCNKAPKKWPRTLHFSALPSFWRPSGFFPPPETSSRASLRPLQKITRELQKTMINSRKGGDTNCDSFLLTLFRPSGRPKRSIVRN